MLFRSALSSNIPVTYKTGTLTFNWAMQYPETAVEPSPFMQAFLPGNRDDQPRRPDGAIQQALVLMNDPTVMNKLVASAAGAASPSLLTTALGFTKNQDLINTLYINILSRFPTAAENQLGNSLLGTTTGTARTQKTQELMWTLYNKVDFMFNY